MWRHFLWRWNIRVTHISFCNIVVYVLYFRKLVPVVILVFTCRNVLLYYYLCVSLSWLLLCLFFLSRNVILSVLLTFPYIYIYKQEVFLTIKPCSINHSFHKISYNGYTKLWIWQLFSNCPFLCTCMLELVFVIVTITRAIDVSLSVKFHIKD